MPNQVRSLLSSVSAQSGVLTRQVNRYDKMKDGPHTPVSLRNLETILNAAKVAVEKIMDLTTELAILEPNNDEHGKRAETDSLRYDQLVSDIGAILQSAAPTPAPAPAAVPQPQIRPQVVKVVETLRPDKLTLDFTPSEFQLWVAAFKSFYTTSKLDTLPVIDQHAFLYACIDNDLQKRIIPQVAQITPLFSDDLAITSMVGLLHSCFLHRYPLVQRRLEFPFVLIQRDGQGRPYIILCGSRSLISAETRYAVIELECLAAVYAMMKCDFYLRGLHAFTLVTDHRPLLGLFEKCPQDITNPRLQRLIEKLAPYGFTVRWVAGKQNTIADALSRQPFFPPAAMDLALNVNCSDDSSDLRLQNFKKAALSDHNYLAVVNALMDRKKPHLLPTTHASRAYSNVWSRLSVENGLLLLDGVRIVPPVAHRKEVLQLLHTSHSGLVKTRKLAQQLYFWPGLMNELKTLIAQCSACQSLQPSLPSEPIIHTVATQAMDEVSADLYEYGGKHYLLMADRYSGYLWVHSLTSLHTDKVTTALLLWFYAYGFPRTIRTDGGPQFRSEFNAFCVKYGISHDVSSPAYPAANGHAEAGVKAAKYLLMKCLRANESFPQALMEWRNTPREDGHSPAQMFFGRRQRTLLPCLSRHLGDIDKGRAQSAKEKVASQRRVYSDLHSRILEPLSIGQRVLVQNTTSLRWDLTGTIIRCTQTGRSYYLRLGNGRVYWRNRKFLRPVGSLVPSSASQSPSMGTPVTTGPFLRPRQGRPNYCQTRKYKSRS